ncbi:MAG: hypothetical protein WAU36_07090 [Cyclobacteriaceae bacterium]
MKHSIQTICLMALAIIYTSCSDDDPQPPNSQPTIEVSDDIVGMTGENQTITVIAADPDGDALDFSWTIIESPSGTEANLTNTSDLNATFTTEIAGLYKVEIIVEDTRGGAASGIVTLYIGGKLPTSINENTVYPNLFDDPSYPDYYALQGIQVTAGVTFDPGVVVESGADVRLWFNGNSSYLKAEGTTAKHITFRGIDKVKGSWRGISISSNNVNNKFDYVDILHTGSSELSSQKTAVYLQSNVSAKLSIKNTNISQSAGYAFYIDGNSGVISAFANNNFNNNDKAPMRIGAENLYVLDKNSVFTDNGIQAIEVSSAGNTNVRFDNAGTIPALNIPYHFYSSAELRAVVTFEAGAICLFDSGKRLWVAAEGAIIANGSASNKIKFSGLTAAAGAWFGFEIASPSTQNLINHAEVSFGGSSGGRGANIYMFGDGAGSKLTITNSTVSNSETYGIRAASGVAVLTQSGNTFSSNPSGNIRQD